MYLSKYTYMWSGLKSDFKYQNETENNFPNKI